MKVTYTNAWNIFVMVAVGTLRLLDLLGFPSMLLAIGLLAAYCYGVYWAINERKNIGDFLQLLVWLVVPCVREKEGEETPYPASPTGLNPRVLETKMERRTVPLEQYRCYQKT